MKRQMILAILVTLCLSFPVFAGDPVTKDIQGALETFTEGCQQELTTYCKDVTPGEGRIIACLYSVKDKLSPSCEYALYDSASQLDRLLTNLSYFASQCRDDLKALCSDVKVGEGRVLDCLNKNEKKVSSRCNSALKDVGYKK